MVLAPVPRGVGRVVEYLKRRGHRAIDLDLVHEHAQAAGASRHLSNPAKVRWSRSVADLYAQERGFRNASWWAVKTPGVILAEMNITAADVSADANGASTAQLFASRALRAEANGASTIRYQGHPADVMDMSFADQALAAEHLLTEGRALAAGVHPVPPALDREVARLKLAALGVEIDVLTEAQRAYLGGWHVGT